jgi:predicted nucleotidyltransferase
MFEKENITPAGLIILGYLAQNPGKEFYLRELSKNLKLSSGGVHKALKRLTKLDLVKSRASGKNLYISVNEDHVGIKNFKIFSNILSLKKVVDAITDISIKVVLFGSMSRGEDISSSDIDLFVLTLQPESVQRALKKVRTQRILKPVIMTPQDLVKMKRDEPAFYREISNGLVMWKGAGYDE